MKKTDTKTKEIVVLFDIDYTLFDTDSFKSSQLKDFELYEEVVEVLGKIGKKATLGIFSEGDFEFQRAKLLETNITSHFGKEHIHIVERKDNTVVGMLDRYPHVRLFLVDDKLPVLHAAKQHKPEIFTIWVKRGKFALKQVEIEGFLPDASVDNLSQVPEIVFNS